MAYDEALAARVREALENSPDALGKVVEKQMFGGLVFMVNGHMCVGVENSNLMMRVGPAQYEEALSRPEARKMDFTGRPMKGYVYVDPTQVTEKAHLRDWVTLCLDFNSTLPPK